MSWDVSINGQEIQHFMWGFNAISIVIIVFQKAPSIDWFIIMCLWSRIPDHKYLERLLCPASFLIRKAVLGSVGKQSFKFVKETTSTVTDLNDDYVKCITTQDGPIYMKVSDNSVWHMCWGDEDILDRK